MTGQEMITSFVIRRDIFATEVGNFEYQADAVKALTEAHKKLNVQHTVEMSKVADLMKAVTAHCKKQGLEPEEYGFSVDIDFKKSAGTIPEKFWNLIAFAVEGSNEGYYVHVGAIISGRGTEQPPQYVDFGLAKTYSPESAYALAREAQRFLTAARWN